MPKDANFAHLRIFAERAGEYCMKTGFYLSDKIQ